MKVKKETRKECRKKERMKKGRKQKATETKGAGQCQYKKKEKMPVFECRFDWFGD